MRHSALPYAPLTLGLVFVLGTPSAAQPPEAPSSYAESVETQGARGGEEDEVDAAGAQAERLESSGHVPGISRRQAKAVEEIVVQARKRQEFLEDTPVSVTALSENALRESGVERLDDIQTLVPNLTFQTDNTGAQSNIRIRGVGTSSTEIAFDPGVGVYVDGVFLPRALGTLVNIVDVQQVEVLRGPQGTLFGKNTVGGAINITTVKPSNELAGFAMVRPGNFNSIDTRFTLNIPILDDLLLMRTSFASRNTPGYSYNSFRDEYLNGHNSLAFLGALRFLPHDDVTIDLTGTWSRDHNNGIAQRCVVGNPDSPLSSLLPPGSPEACSETTPFETTSNLAALTDLESYGAWMVADWDVGEVPFMGDISVKSLTSWRQQNPRTRFDVDGTDFIIVQLSNVGGGAPLDGTPGFQRQIMQEGQLNGSALDDRLNYVAGAFGFWEKGNGGDRVTYVLPPGQGNPIALNQQSLQTVSIDNWTWALYGQATYDVLDWLSLTGGIRYTQDKKGLTFESFDVPTGSQTGNEAGDKVFQAWTPMGSIAATLPEDLISDTPLDHVMGYFTYSEGFKGGGFNGVATGTSSGSTVGSGVAFAYGPETLDNFEIGLKLIGFDQRATLNTSFFIGKYDDIQVTQIRDTGTGPDGAPTISRITDNAATATTKGFEIELLTTPTDGLLIMGNVGYTDATYDDFSEGLSDYDGNPLDRSGDRFLFTPRLQTFLAAQYSFAMPGLDGSPMSGWFTPRVEWAYVSSVQWLGPEVPEATQSGYNLLNARFSYDFMDDRAQVALWAKNLLNVAYFTNVTPTVSTVGFLTRAYAAPRTYGAELSWRF
ncbi:MAG: TonB-dependent receptor [Candidatus Binatia bacterium]|nr:TonB-dependent receptor [Candidatus Binatia bacterium]